MIVLITVDFYGINKVVSSMATRLSGGQSLKQAATSEHEIALALSRALGVEAPRQESLNSAFYAVLRPVLAGLQDGTLTDEQASLLIELLVAAYAGSAINRQIDNLFQGWAERMITAGLGEGSGRR